MKKLVSLTCVALLILLDSLFALSQRRSESGLQDKRITSMLAQLEKVHLYGSPKQAEIAKTRKVTDAEILCLYEGQTVDSINHSGYEWHRSYHFCRDGSLANYRESGEDYALELVISGNRILSAINSENDEEGRCEVMYIPIGENTYLLQMKTMQGEKVNSGLNDSKITFDNKGRIIAISYTYDYGKSYSVVSKFHYDKFGNARNEQGQLCIPMLNDGHLDTCTKLVLRSSTTLNTPYAEGFAYGMDIESDSMSNITIFIRGFDPRAEVGGEKD